MEALSPLLRQSALHGWALLLAGLMLGGAAFSQTAPTPSRPPSSPSAAKAVKRSVGGMPWSSLSAAQKNALHPLEHQWDGIDSARQGKWIEVANRFPSMPPAERNRIQARMADWAKLTPHERGQARLNYKEAQQVPAQERNAKWEAYKALPPDQQKQLAARAAPPARKPMDVPAGDAGGTKSNVVPNSSYAPRPAAIAPTVAQAKPGATTNLITKRPAPPAHQQTGLPKIAVTPGFVDQSTLLPKRGPQGAATRSAAVAAPSAPSP